jgi:hypothetical protein
MHVNNARHFRVSVVKIALLTLVTAARFVANQNGGATVHDE